MSGQGTLEEVLDQVRCLAGRTREVTDLPGGLTNRNCRVRTATRDVVVRISGGSSGLLAVDRDAEYENSRRASEVGVGAPVVDYLPGRGVLVVEYLPSSTFTDADVAGNLPRIAEAVRSLHSAEPFVNRFDFFALHRRYLDIMRTHGFRMPPGYVDLLDNATRMEAALTNRPEPLVSCHNDLLAANFLDDGERVRIIDYEYSGCNEASFELGNIIQEARLTSEHLDELCAAYLGREDPALVARAELWGIMAAYGWTLWGTIQAGASDLDFDFWGWGMSKLDRAREAFTGRRFERLLDLVGGQA